MIREYIKWSDIFRCELESLPQSTHWRLILRVQHIKNPHFNIPKYNKPFMGHNFNVGKSKK